MACEWPVIADPTTIRQRANSIDSEVLTPLARKELKRADRRRPWRQEERESNAIRCARAPSDLLRLFQPSLPSTRDSAKVIHRPPSESDRRRSIRRNSNRLPRSRATTYGTYGGFLSQELNGRAFEWLNLSPNRERTQPERPFSRNESIGFETLADA